MSLFVQFAVETGRFGIALADVREVVRATSIVPLPKAPAAIEGVVDFRGTVVPVFDIRKRFRLAARPLALTDQFIAAQARRRQVVLRVDHVVDVVDIPAGHIASAAAISPRTDYVSGVASLPDGLLLLHDLGTFLSDAESAEVDAVIAGTSP